MARKATELEIHEHSYVSGPNANRSWCSKVVHSHEGGTVPHDHEDTGPASYTIDKDEWRRATGLHGGGRKKFTARPSGIQTPLRALRADQLTYEIVVVGQPSSGNAVGPGLAVPARLDMTFGMRPEILNARKAT